MITLPFEKIYVLHLVEEPERLKGLYEEFKRFDISNELNIWWACKHPHITTLAHHLKDKKLFLWNGYGDGSALNCTREHYNIVKQAYCRGFNSIAIIEDDFRFKEPLDKIERLFKYRSLPHDWDIIRYGYYFMPEYIDNDDILNSPEELYYKKQQRSNNNWSTCFYALNNKGMEYYLESLMNYYAVADNPLYEANENEVKLNCYQTNISLYRHDNKIKTTIQ